MGFGTSFSCFAVAVVGVGVANDGDVVTREIGDGAFSIIDKVAVVGIGWERQPNVWSGHSGFLFVSRLPEMGNVHV